MSDILTAAHRNNLRDGITGLLIHHNNLFFQVLEGPTEAVKECYSRIAKDRLHTNLAILWEGEVDARNYPRWAMGLANPDQITPPIKDALHSLAKLKKDNETLLTGDTMAGTLARWVMLEIPDTH